LAGAVFGVEVLYVGQMLYDVLLPSFLSGIVAYLTAINLGVVYGMPTLSMTPDLSMAGILWALAAGIFFGGVARIHIGLLEWGEERFKDPRLPRWARPLAGGAILLLLAAIFGTRYLGLGTSVIDQAVKGGEIPLGAFLMKSLFMAVTLSCGGSGGVVTPTFFVGATAGSAFGRVLGLNSGFYAALGLVGVLAGAANTPIAATLMAAELFGGETASLAGVACVVAFMVSGHRSLYPSQILARPKSRAFVLTGGGESSPGDAKAQTSRLYGVRLVRYLRRRLKEYLRGDSRRGG
jgi:H+/Cl- antiporter ClcA